VKDLFGQPGIEHLELVKLACRRDQVLPVLGGVTERGMKTDKQTYSGTAGATIFPIYVGHILKPINEMCKGYRVGFKGSIAREWCASLGIDCTSGMEKLSWKVQYKVTFTLCAG
jgi:hypothetical protein